MTLKHVANLVTQLGNPNEISKLNDLVANGIDYEDEFCGICMETIDSAVIASCGDIFCKACTSNISEDESFQCPICRTTCSTFLYVPRTSNREESRSPNPPGSPEDEFSANAMVESHTTSNNKMTSSISSWEGSTKIDALMQELIKLQSKDETIKSIVFSQWTSMLDLCEIPLKMKDIKFVRLDGGMAHHQREKAVHLFKTDPTVTVFLISMKAGGLGLNLVAASHVFLLDPWWNPATEDQAIDRVHRLGQTKPVEVTRFIVNGSIEERILELQERKKMLAQGALGLNNKELRQIRIDELRLLFRED
jgi:SNF2 family DNA or RNA helicase